MAIFRNSRSTLSVNVIKECRKKSFFVRNRITLQAAILDCSEAAIHGHPFFFYKYYYTTTSKLKITITIHQKILAAPGNNKKNVKVTKSKYKYNKLKNSEMENAWLLLQEYLVVVVKTY